MMYKFSLIYFSLISIPLNIPHSTPNRTQINPFNAKQKPGMDVTTSKRMRWRRFAAPPLFKLQSSVTTSKRMRWRRLAAPPLLEP